MGGSICADLRTILVVMAFGTTIQALLKLARVALASLLLVGVPMADAVACAGEEIPSHASAFADSDAVEELSVSTDTSEHEPQSGSDAQHCIHGHCHHSTTMKAGVEEAKPTSEAAIAMSPRTGAVAIVRVANGLERPPKA
jgi:hypothetical protein